ncbi:formyltetrahydrofolate deformylase [Glutamicibacter sp. X7]
MDSRADSYVLTLSCTDKVGIVHAVTGVLAQHHSNITELKQFNDVRAGQYFLRIEFYLGSASDASSNIDSLEAALKPVVENFDATWGLRPAGAKKRVLVMVSKFGHCLNDLLFRARMGELPVEIAAVVSNHPDHRQQVEWHGIPFFHVPVTAETKPEAEARLVDLIDRFEIDLVVLARYMQVLSDELTRQLTGRAINIHHSFLPSFKGAKPYHQAFERGVKTVGATAHYVNSELDEGPIIAQQVKDVDHSFGPEDLVAAGRDTECKALSDAVRWHCEDRVFLNGSRTVVLR